MTEFKKIMLNQCKMVPVFLGCILVLAITPLLFTVSVYAANAVYDCGDYGADAYSDNCATETIQGGDEGSSEGGILSGSGQRIALYTSLSLVCIGGAIYILVKAKKSSTDSDKTPGNSTQG